MRRHLLAGLSLVVAGVLSESLESEKAPQVLSSGTEQPLLSSSFASAQESASELALTPEPSTTPTTASETISSDSRDSPTQISIRMTTEVDVCSKCTTSNIFAWADSTSAASSSLSVVASTGSSMLSIDALTTTDETTASEVTSTINPEISEVHELLETQEILQIPIEIELGNTTFNGTSQTNETDDCHFMSFEEWKKNKEEDSKNQTVTASTVSKVTSKIVKETISNSTSSAVELQKKKDSSVEDQGRVYKDKFNYASVDCAATVVKTNSQAKGARAILVENKDSYLLNQCSIPNKFVVIELCQDILVESVIIGNFEFFSSMFKDIRVSVSDRFPANNWHVIGEFQAENIRDIQSFNIENPLIWARYLQLEILTHYGNEFYCPISLVRVHGKTMMDELKEGQERSVEDSEQEAQFAEVDELEGDKLADSALIENEECRVVLPHLRLNEFLKEINSTRQFCDATSPTTIEETQNPTPHTQESVYKNIMKRLSLLESNATLSLLYVEEQSKLLSSAFTNLERRQSANFQNLVEAFNTSVVNQLDHFKKSYASMHSEYERLFRMQENSHENSMADSKRTVSDLSSQASFQKRLTIFNSIVILCLLIYVVLTRDVYVYNEEDQDTQELVPRVPKNRNASRTRKVHRAGLSHRRRRRA